MLPNDHYTESNLKDVLGLCIVDKLLKWCFICNSNYYLVFTSIDYPERVGYQLLEIVKEKTEKILNTRSLSYLNSNMDDIQMILLEVSRDYNDPTNKDKLFSVNTQIKNITNDMKLNVKKNFESNDSLSVTK